MYIQALGILWHVYWPRYVWQLEVFEECLPRAEYSRDMLRG